MRIIRFAGLAVAALLAACATTPPPNDNLAEAHAAVQNLSAQPDAAQSAGKPLQDARDLLAQAEAASLAHKSSDEVAHLAYMAKRQADLGEAMLAEARARAQASNAAAERNRIVLEARDREVAEAKQKADDAQQQLADLAAKKTDRGMVITLGDVLFDTGKDTLKSGAAVNLDRLSKYLESSPGTKIIVEGHTDSRGSDDYNDALSQRRAQSVAGVLENQGISADRISTVGRGKRYPVASNDTPAGRQQNRRVEIVFSDAQGQFPPAAERAS